MFYEFRTDLSSQSIAEEVEINVSPTFLIMDYLFLTIKMTSFFFFTVFYSVSIHIFLLLYSIVNHTLFILFVTVRLIMLCYSRNSFLHTKQLIHYFDYLDLDQGQALKK